MKKNTFGQSSRLNKTVSIAFLSAFTAVILSVASSLTWAAPGDVHDDKQLQTAIQNKKNAYFVEAANLSVTQLLPDDTQGLPHQKWVATLSNGLKIQIVYNLNMGLKVPIKVGDKFAVGGQFIWTDQGGLVHWTHEDPKQVRPDGYVMYNNVIYGDTDKDGK